MITERNMIFANPQAYRVFPLIGNPYNTGLVDTATYTGHIVVTDSSGNTKNFSHTSTIDFTGFSGYIDVDLYTDTGSVKLGRWEMTQSIIITNDITITVTPISEVSSDGATITPLYLVKYNTYSNEELTESTIVTPDSITLLSNVGWITISNNQIVIAANTDTEPRQGLVMIQVKYQEYSTSANYNIVQAGYNIAEDIKDAMVLWYDISRQGATNDSMKTNPVLKDLSGNGHDATCYNFAWSGMSGVGGYVTSFSCFTKNSNLDVEDTKLEIHRTEDAGWYVADASPSKYNNVSYQVKITGVDSSTSGDLLRFAVERKSDSEIISLQVFPSDGIHTIDLIPEEYMTEDYIIRWITNLVGIVTIELIPQYPNALVSDGVDDYMSDIEVNKELSSFIVQIEGIEGGNPGGGYQVPVFISKDIIGDISIWRNSNAITYLNEINSKDLVMSLWNDKGASIVSNALSGKTVVYGDWDNSKPKRIMIANNETISDTIKNEHSLYSFFRDINSASYKKAALYSFILFNRTLTTDEIEWVKTNLIEGDTEL